MEVITLERKVLAKNDEIAAENRRLFSDKKLLVVNLLSSPGAGKTSLLERTLENCRDRAKIGVVVGDVQTDNDARRIDIYQAPVVQIITSGSCHLDSKMVQSAVEKLNLDALDILIIENVGNLVCPTNFDLGEHYRVVVLSTAEGTDKPLKYPAMFHRADCVIINKIDLLPFTNFSVDEARASISGLNSGAVILETSCRTGEGIDIWCKWLFSKIIKQRVTV
jgi:hydrogenase nickel incorporation protein HypB